VSQELSEETSESALQPEKNRAERSADREMDLAEADCRGQGPFSLLTARLVQHP